MNQNRLAVRFERALALALLAPDPLLAVRRIGRDRRHPRSLCRALRRVHGDGVQMAALLVARLRFERLVRGCPEAEAWFDGDGDGFAVVFRRYHTEVRPTAFFPADEARLFRAWRARAGT